MKKILIIISLIFMLSGCFDYIEVDDLLIISGILIDYEDDKFKITSQLIENDEKTVVKVVTTEGETIEECIAEISKLSNKDIFLSHLKVVVITDNIIKNNINFYDYFLREPKSKMNFYLYTVSNEDKDKIFNMNKKDDGSALFIKDMMDFNNKIFSTSTPTSFLDYMYKKLEVGLTPIYPNLTIKKNNDEDILYLQDIIIYDDNQNKFKLDDKEGVFYNIITNNVEETVINIPCNENENNDNFSLNIYFIKSNFKWKNEVFNIDTKITGKINSYSCKYDLTDNKTIEKLNNLASEYINENINNVVNIAKENKTDFIGIGNYIYKHDKNYFDFENDNWNNKLSNIKVKVNTNTTIKYIGEVRK